MAQTRGPGALLVTLALVAGGVGSAGRAEAAPADQLPSAYAAPAGRTAALRAPLAGKTVVIDPGHQLGNHNYPREINRSVPAGGFRKPCNTTGTATNAGFPEATFVWQVSRVLRK